MCSLSPKDIGQFRELWRHQIGLEISQDDAESYAVSLLSLISLATEELPTEREEPP